MTARDWAELLRLPAWCSVPGDTLAGSAAAGHRPGPATLRAAAASLCLYQAGMALNDWSDRHLDAVERPERPLPSGRVTPASALTAAALLTAAGVGLAATTGRAAAVTATALATTVWAYDLTLKHTPAAPAAMAAARGLDVLLGAAAVPRGGTRPPRAAAALRAALPAAGLLAAHTAAVTAVSRREATGGGPAAPAAALAATSAVALAAGPGRAFTDPARLPQTAAAALYAAGCLRPLTHAALNPSPHFLQQAVGGGIRAMIPLQAALAARAGAPATGLSLLALLPLARRLSRKVSPT
ncbi:UbiA family prenyltransferase [Streptomyces sp. 549]|uniref:SCO3242 family prenyltransferase n=1 Tax=Streptomyces sp. 549 TaxID=3049076 RepID=UPI0024C4597A|nr:UbiA family prenyltransferase [Streptomyces sp. 549]MDK1472085.1 UbiA family prenyltransferase [Streptomyces sp. 549]